MRTLVLCAALVPAMLGSAASAAVTFTQAYVQSRIVLSSTGADFVNDSRQLTVPSYPSGSINQSSGGTVVGTGGTASGRGSTTATFDDTSSGTVNFSVNATVAASGTGGVEAQGFAVFFYDFVSDTPFQVLYEYEIGASSPDPFGPTAQVQVFRGGNASPAFRLADISDAGSVTSQVFEAGAYRVQIGQDRIVGIGRTSGAPASESLSGNVRFAITAAPVPEPATWGMMLLGFGLVGAAARRRSRGVAAA